MKNKNPLYLEIYSNFVEDIKSGKIKPYEKLPSKRNLSKKFGVSLITVEKAYEQLLVEGYIEAIEKKGYFANKINIIKNKQKINKEIKEEEIKTYLYDFTSSNANNHFPFSTWAKITRKILNEKKELILKPCSFKGEQSLRVAIAEHLNNYLGMDVSYRQIIIGSGSEYLYSLLINFFGKDLNYILEDPCYTGISLIYKQNGIKPLYIPLDKHGIDINILKNKKADIIHVSTNHHYPSGITMPISRRYELLEIAKEKNAIIIEDDYDVELRLKGKPIKPLFSLDNNNNTIYMNTFSITLTPSFRIAYMILPFNLLKEYEQKIAIYKCTVPVFDQMILAQFIKDGSFERLLNRKKKNYRDLRKQFIDYLKSDEIINDLDLIEAESGLHLLIKYPYKIKDKEVEELALKEDIKIYTLSHFLNKQVNSNALLIKYTSFNKTNMQASTKALLRLLYLIKSKTND